MLFFIAILGNECRLSNDRYQILLFNSYEGAEEAAKKEWGVDAMPYVTIQQAVVY